MSQKSTYALLIYRTGTPEPQGASLDGVFEGHRALQRDTAARGDLHSVARLADAPAGKTVRIHKGVHEVSDGPYVEAKEWLVGFYLLDCRSAAEALDEAKRISTEHHAIEVRPVTWRYRQPTERDES